MTRIKSLLAKTCQFCRTEFHSVEMLVRCAFLVVLAACAVRCQNPEDYRLPEGAVTVDNYDIDLRLPADLFTNYEYTGTVDITFTNLIETNLTKLHAYDMTINPPTLVKVEDTANVPVNITTTDFVIDANTDILTLEVEEPLVVDGVYKLTITYTARLRTDEMSGFYLSTYYNESGEAIPLGATQFQATAARKVFPCFDEPSYKATFNLKITHLGIYTAIGNTPGTQSPVTDQPDFTLTTFEPTPRMSTYLVAFIISDFDCTASPEVAGQLPHQVCSRTEQSTNRAKAVEYGPRLITVMETYTGITYNSSGIGKMDQVAIPDFSAGAMENWGLLTYRETGLLWNEAQSSNSYLQGLGSVVAHEVVHMWFGNLVTTKWWSTTFLNEGFARLFQYFAFGQVETSWQLEQQFVTAVLQPMLVVDAQPAAAPLVKDVFTQSEISSRFTTVSYNKGGSVLRMIRDSIMGPDGFKQGLQEYLALHSESSTTPEDLWTSLQPHVPAANLPATTTLSQVMQSWVNRAGFPVLLVSEQGTSVNITQRKFVVSGIPGVEDQWYVPITYTLSTSEDAGNVFDNTIVKRWVLPATGLTIENALPAETDWIVLNNQQVGFYRVRYSDTLFAKIEAALKANVSSIPELNRAQLVDDVYNLARVNTYNYERVFEFFQFLKDDTSYYSWNAAFRAFSSILQRTSNTQIIESITAYILPLMSNLLSELQFATPNNVNQIYTLNRVQAHTWACRLGLEDCITRSVAAFEAYRTAGTIPDKNLKTIIYCNGLRHSTDPARDWNFLWAKYESESLATEEATILSTLGCSTNREVLLGYLEKSINETSGIRRQDASSVFSSVYTSNPVGVDIAFEFLRDKYQAISDYYGSMNALINIFNGLTERFTTQAQITLLEEFLTSEADSLTETVRNAGAEALENAKANLLLNAAFEEQLKSYFKLVDDTGTADSLQIGFATTVISLMMVLYQMWI